MLEINYAIFWPPHKMKLTRGKKQASLTLTVISSSFVLLHTWSNITQRKVQLTRTVTLKKAKTVGCFYLYNTNEPPPFNHYFFYCEFLFLEQKGVHVPWKNRRKYMCITWSRPINIRIYTRTIYSPPERAKLRNFSPRIVRAQNFVPTKIR